MFNTDINRETIVIIIKYSYKYCTLAQLLKLITITVIADSIRVHSLVKCENQSSRPSLLTLYKKKVK